MTTITNLFRRHAANSRLPDPIVVPSSAPAFPIALNVHAIDDAAVRALIQLGVRQVRWTLYWALWDQPRYAADASTQIARARDAGIDLLVCAHRTPAALARDDEWARRAEILPRYVEWLAARAATWPWVTWQPWNEVDTSSSTTLFSGSASEQITSYNRGTLYGAHLTALAAALGTGVRLVSSAAGGPSPASFIAGMLATAAAVPLTAIAVHAYGPPPATALVERAGQVRAILPPSAPPLWCTEFGICGRDITRAGWVLGGDVDARIAVEWQATADAAPSVVARAYGYCFDASDEYGILGTPTADWLARHNAGART